MDFEYLCVRVLYSLHGYIHPPLRYVESYKQMAAVSMDPVSRSNDC